MGVDGHVYKSKFFRKIYDINGPAFYLKVSKQKKIGRRTFSMFR